MWLSILRDTVNSLMSIPANTRDLSHEAYRFNLIRTTWFSPYPVQSAGLEEALEKQDDHMIELAVRQIDVCATFR